MVMGDLVLTEDEVEPVMMKLPGGRHTRILQETLGGTIFSRLVILALCKFSGAPQVNAISTTYDWGPLFGSGLATAVFEVTNPPPRRLL
jgi:hypothetical protein